MAKKAFHIPSFGIPSYPLLFFSPSFHQTLLPQFEYAPVPCWGNWDQGSPSTKGSPLALQSNPEIR